MPGRRAREDQNFWNFLFSVFFIAVLAMALAALAARPEGLPRSVPVFDAVLMAFAAFRVTRLLVYDKIARWFRELFMDTRVLNEDGRTFVEVSAPSSGFRHTVADLLACPWCIGIWSALVISLSYYLFPWAWFVILFLALAGAGSLLQICANAIGWHAEALKLEARERDRDLRL